VDPALIGHDIAYPAMLKFLPAGFIGLMVGGLIAANSSTILTHLNWGASYLVHDFYRRFVKRDASEPHYVLAGRVVTVLLFVAASGTVYLLDTAKDAFDIILQVGAGTGLLYLVRWFWWRVNAWCEIVAMISSFATSVVLLGLVRNGAAISTHAALLITVAVTTGCWLLAAYLASAFCRWELSLRPDRIRDCADDYLRHQRPYRRPHCRQALVRVGTTSHARATLNVRRFNSNISGYGAILAPASCAIAASVVCAAFKPRRKSLSVNVAKMSVG
jgi:hypothetical protein